MRRHNTYQTLGATSATASAADHAQYELREGPCVDATDRGAWYRSGDVANDNRWPRWRPAAAGLGLRSMLSVHLTAHGEPFGSLNMSSDRVGAFGDRDQVDLATLFAVHAAAALVSACRIAGLEIALASRTDIGAAQGILIAKYALDQRSAFAVLARISSHTNTKIRDIAAEVVRTGTLPEGATGLD